MAVEELGSGKGLCDHFSSNIGNKFVTCVISLFSGCCLDDGSQPGDHLGGGEAAEEEVDP